MHLPEAPGPLDYYTLISLFAPPHLAGGTFEIHLGPLGAKRLSSHPDFSVNGLTYGIKMIICNYPDAANGKATIVCGNWTQVVTWDPPNIFMRALNGVVNFFKRIFNARAIFSK